MGLETNIMGVFVDGNSLCGKTCAFYVKGVFREFKFDRQFCQETLRFCVLNSCMRESLLCLGTDWELIVCCIA